MEEAEESLVETETEVGELVPRDTTQNQLNDEKLKEVENLLVNVGDFWKCKVCGTVLAMKNTVELEDGFPAQLLGLQ